MKYKYFILYKKRLRTLSVFFYIIFIGSGWGIRTPDRGFRVPCLTAWLIPNRKFRGKHECFPINFSVILIKKHNSWKLFELDSSSSFFKLSFEFICIIFRCTFFDNSTFINKFFRFTKTESCNFFYYFDNCDFFVNQQR